MRYYYPKAGTQGQCRLWGWWKGEPWRLLGTKRFRYGNRGTTPRLRFELAGDPATRTQPRLLCGADQQLLIADGPPLGTGRLEFGARLEEFGWVWIEPPNCFFSVSVPGSVTVEPTYCRLEVT